MEAWQAAIIYGLWILFCIQSARLLGMLWSENWNSEE